MNFTQKEIVLIELGLMMRKNELMEKYNRTNDIWYKSQADDTIKILDKTLVEFNRLQELNSNNF